jgi:hypothetical protein
MHPGGDVDCRSGATARRVRLMYGCFYAAAAHASLVDAHGGSASLFPLSDGGEGPATSTRRVTRNRRNRPFPLRFQNYRSRYEGRKGRVLGSRARIACGSFAGFGDASSCTVLQGRQRAPWISCVKIVCYVLYPGMGLRWSEVQILSPRPRNTKACGCSVVSIRLGGERGGNRCRQGVPGGDRGGARPLQRAASRQSDSVERWGETPGA